MFFALLGSEHSKAAHKTMAKSGLNFINILCTAFTLADPKSVKRYTDDLPVFFTHLGSTSIKVACKTLVKLTLDFMNVVKC